MTPPVRCTVPSPDGSGEILDSARVGAVRQGTPPRGDGHESQGGERVRARAEGRGYALGQRLPEQPRQHRARREGVPILMMGEERFAVAVADAYSRVTCGKQIGVCTIMANLNAAGIQMAYGAI